MSAQENGVVRFKAQLEEMIGVLSTPDGVAAWVFLGEDPAAQAGAHGTFDEAKEAAQRLLDTLALGLIPVVQSALAEAQSGCPEPAQQPTPHDREQKRIGRAIRVTRARQLAQRVGSWVDLPDGGGAPRCELLWLLGYCRAMLLQLADSLEGGAA